MAKLSKTELREIGKVLAGAVLIALLCFGISGVASLIYATLAILNSEFSFYIFTIIWAYGSLAAFFSLLLGWKISERSNKRKIKS